MKYIKATEVLPDRLLIEIQEHIEGSIIYIPKKRSNYTMWGEKSGARMNYIIRNINIKMDFISGHTIDQLSDEYGLSIESIKRIVYTK